MSTSENISQGSARKPIRDSESEPTTHREGPLARAIEFQTARLPSDVFLWSAIGAIGASALLMLRGRKQVANFVGQWAPTLLIFGLYNKIVKVAGSDRLEQGRPFFRENEPERLH